MFLCLQSKVKIQWNKWFWPISLLDFSNQLVCGELSTDHQYQVLDDVFRAVHVE